MKFRYFFPAALGLLVGTAVAGEPDFQVNERTAKSNLQSDEGASYDRALGQALQASPNLEPGMTECLIEYPGDQSVHGYFHFTSATSYRVVLEPQNGFSDCLADALEGYKVPPPPSVPYFNHFVFSTEPADRSD